MSSDKRTTLENILKESGIEFTVTEHPEVNHLYTLVLWLA